MSGVIVAPSTAEAPTVIQRILFAGLLLLAATGCDSSTSGAETGTFQTTLFDAEDAPAYAGELRLEFSEGPTDGPQPVTGRWQLEGRNGRPDLAPGSGSISGSRIGANIGLTLLTESSDSGIELSGTLSGDRIDGTWSRITIAGPTPVGAFEAVRD